MTLFDQEIVTCPCGHAYEIHDGTRCGYPHCRGCGAAEGARLAEKAIAQVAEHADPDWLSGTLAVVRAIAKEGIEFTTDEVWARLAETPGITTPEPRAMGAVMRRALSRGWITPTDEYRPSVRPETHRNPKRVWRSRIVA